MGKTKSLLILILFIFLSDCLNSENFALKNKIPKHHLYIEGVYLYPQILSTEYQKKFSISIKYVLLLDDQTEGKKEEGLR